MCGIVGIVGNPQASQEVHQALLMLQHRGQDSAGILSVDSRFGKFHVHKELGQVAQVFQKKDIERLKGDAAIGHTRYSTIGEIKEADLQPMALSLPVGIGMVHNGNVSNYSEVRDEMLGKKRFFMSDNDVEMILHVMAESYARASDEKSIFRRVCLSVKDVLAKTEGGYSVVGLLGNEGMFAFRDPHGIRPLVLGSRDEGNGKKSYCVTSETCALKFLGYDFERDVRAGELIWMDHEGGFQSASITEKTSLPCMFEWVYFSSADSTLEKKNVYEARLNLGTLLGERIQSTIAKSGIQFDVVAPVPDTSRPSAISLAETLGVPFREVLIKNRYVQRSFITSGQDRRQLAVGLKFSVVDELVRGKRVLLVDDSIVRGTTSKKIVELLKLRGAKEIYLASTCPPIIHPCFYGIDFPNHKDLIAYHRDSKQVADYLGVSGVFYSTEEDLSKALDKTEFCGACLDGKYAYPVRASILNQEHPGVHS
jgi:amidophosphoribosyltransferase